MENKRRKESGCEKGESNPHSRNGHMALNHACLPIPPFSRIQTLSGYPEAERGAFITLPRFSVNTDSPTIKPSYSDSGAASAGFSSAGAASAGAASAGAASAGAASVGAASAGAASAGAASAGAASASSALSAS